MKLRRIRKRIKIFLAKINRAIVKGMWEIRAEKTRQDRMVIKIVRTLLDTPDCKVYYAPSASRIYLHSKDNRYIISFDKQSIKITNHKFFFNADLREHIGEELVSAATDRLERDLKKLSEEILYNEDTFLAEVYSNFRKKSRAKEIQSSTADKIFSDQQKLHVESFDISKIVPQIL